MKREKQSGVGIGHRHNHLRASCAMERERLLGAAAPVLEASTSGFPLDGVVHPRRDRARLAATVAALLGSPRSRAAPSRARPSPRSATADPPSRVSRGLPTRGAPSTTRCLGGRGPRL